MAMQLERLVFLLISIQSCQASVQFLAEPEDQIVAQGADVWWHCRAHNPFNPAAIVYRWRFMSLTITEGSRHHIFNNGTLTLHHVTNADFGIYQCVASDGDTESFSRRATLSRAYIAPAFKLHPNTVYTHVGDNVELTCEINSLPTALLSWQRNNQPITRGMVTMVNRQRSVLELRDVTYSDVGAYRCRAVNAVLSEVRYSSAATLELEGKPRFVVAPSPQTVGVGTMAEFLCSANGFPDPIMEWVDARNSNNQRRITTGGKYIVTNSSLRILDVHQTDSGFYTCRASNNWGQEAKTVLLTVLDSAERPRFTNTPEDTSVMEGETVTWTCSASGRPQPIITWGKVDGELPESRTELPYPGTVRIHDVGKADAGSYICRAAGSSEVITHKWALSVQVGPTFGQMPEDVAVDRGETLSLPCQASGVPQPSLAWKLPTGIEVPVPGSSRAHKLTTYSNGTLIISDVREEDAGRYMCIARNVVSTRSTSAAVYVYFGPQFITSPTNTLATEGTEATFHCAGSGFPLPTVTWYGPSSNHTLRTDEDIRLLSNGSIVIYSVQRGQEGRYTCVLDNGINQMVVTAELKIIVRPYFTSEALSVVVAEGSNLWLHCVAKGTPNPTLEWKRNDRLLLLEENMMIHPNGTLFIRGITRSQFGNYICQATNEAGKKEQISTVWKNDIPVFTRPPVNTTGNATSMATFHCEAVARARPEMVWFRLDELGRPRDQLTNEGLSGRGYITDDGALVLQELEEKDEGWYACVARNSHGNASKKAYLDVRIPPAVDSSPIPVIAETGSPATLLCQVRSDPPPTVSWQPPRSSDVIKTSSPEFGLMGNTLVITSADVSRDAGSWRCQACNYLGCHHGYVQLSVQGRPVLVAADSYVNRAANITRIKCLAVGTPVPKVNYFWGQLEIDPRSPPPGLTITEGNWLQVTGISRPPYGCMASNVYGHDMRPLSVPFPPKQLSATNLTDTSLVLSWTLDGPTLLQPSYVIVRVITPTIEGRSPDEIIVPTSLKAQQYPDVSQRMVYTLKELQPYTRYNLQVAAHNALGNSENSKTVAVTTVEGAPTPVREVRAVLDAGELLVTWKQPLRINGMREHLLYEIEYHNSPSETTMTVVHNGTSKLQAIFRDVKYGDIVNIQVTAVNTVTQLRSTPAHILLVLNEKPPSRAPADVRARTARSGSIHIEWKKPVLETGSVMGYMVAVGKSTAQEFTLFRLDNAKTLNYRVSDLPSGGYDVKVAAYNHGGVGPYSSLVTVKVPTDPGAVGGSSLSSLDHTEVVAIVAACVAVVFLVLLILFACCHYHNHRRNLLEKDIDAIYQQKDTHLYDNKGFTTDTIGSHQSVGRGYYDAIDIGKDVDGVTPSATPAVTPIMSQYRHKHPRLGLAPDVVLVTEHPSHTYTSPSIIRSNRLGAADFELAELTYGHSPMSSQHGKAFHMSRGSLRSEAEIYAELDFAQRGAVNQIYADIHPSRPSGSQQLRASRSLSRSRSSLGSTLGLLPEESMTESTESPSGSDANEAVSFSRPTPKPQPKPIYSIPVKNNQNKTSNLQLRKARTDYETKVSRMDFDSESSGEPETNIKSALKNSATSRFNSDITFWQTTNEQSAELF